MPISATCRGTNKQAGRRKPLGGLPRLRALPRPGVNRPRRVKERARRLSQDVLAMAEFEAALEGMGEE